MEYYDANDGEITNGELAKIIKTSFGYDDVINIDKVFPKTKPKLSLIQMLKENKN